MDLQSWAKKKEDKELIAFLENVKSYQVILMTFFTLITIKLNMIILLLESYQEFSSSSRKK